MSSNAHAISRREGSSSDADGGGHLSVVTQLSHAPFANGNGAIFASSPMRSTPREEGAEAGHARHVTQRSPAGPVLSYELIGLYAANLDDMQKARLATENRIRSITAPVEKGGLGLEGPMVDGIDRILALLEKAEAEAKRGLMREVRRCPVGPFILGQPGLGKSNPGLVGRLLGEIGDPAWHSRDNRPRTLGELTAYCGEHVIQTGDASQGGGDTQDSAAGVAPRRRRGERANWNSRARSFLYLLAESVIKALNERYRAVYDEAKAQRAGTVHVVQCQNTVRPPKGATGPIRTNGCGTQEHPEWGAPGSPLRPGHVHAHALRLTAKAILRDLWEAAREARGPA